MTTTYENIRLERDGHVATLTIDRARVNPLNLATLAELIAALESLHADASVRVLVVTGAGKSFVAGADIKEMSEMTVDEARAFSHRGHNALALLAQAPFATIAAVNGYALGGGCELALACDIIYASERAVFGQPEVNLGVIPGFGGTQRLSRTVGTMVARELVLTGRMVKADEALRLGLAAQVFPAETFMDEVTTLARTIASKGPLAVREAKSVMGRGWDVSLGEANALESEAFAQLFASRDQREGMAAFIGKRDAEFTGE